MLGSNNPTSQQLRRFTRGNLAYKDLRNEEIARKRGDFVVAVLVFVVLLTFEPNIKRWILTSPFGKFFRQVSNPQLTTEISKPAPKPQRIKPYTIEAPHFLDNSPIGAYDFTLIQDGSKFPPIPAPCNGKIRKVWFQGVSGNLITGRGAGQIVDLICSEENYGWRLGHLQLNPPVQEGQRVGKGQTIGYQGITGRTSGAHIHAQIHEKGEWRRLTNRKNTRSIVDEYLTFLRTGQ